MDTNSFSIMPMSQEISLTPGETYAGTITIANPASSTSDLSYTAAISPYGVLGADYSVDLLSESSRTEMINWITLHNAAGTITPNGTAEVRFTIDVPKTATPGGQYAAIKVIKNTADAASGELSINNIYEVASIIYGNVAGEVVHDSTVTSQFIPNFTTTPEFTSTATVENHGTVHEDALVNFTITNAFNGSTIYPHSSSDTGINEVIMPDTTRELSYTFKDMPALGPINITQTIDYGGQAYTQSQTLFICPVWFMVIMATLLLSTAALIVAHIAKSRHRKQTSKL